MENSIVQLDNCRSKYPTIKFMKTLPGVMMLVNFILLMVCWGIMVDWKVNVEEPYASKFASETGYYLFVTVFPWILYIVFFINLILGCHHQFRNIKWPFAFFIICVLWDFLLFAAACVIFLQTLDSPYDACLCGRLYAASAFGYLTSCGLGYQGYCHYREYEESSGRNQYPTTGAV